MRVAVTGASGLLGRALCRALEQRGDSLLRLVRREPRAGEARWDASQDLLDPGALLGVDAVIHLAGEDVGGGLWTRKRKQRILDSRSRGTQLLCAGLARMSDPPAALLCASAIGFYGDSGQRLVDERSEPGQGFLAEVTRAWEDAAAPARAAGLRVVHARLGVVLAREGGALQRLLLPFRLGLGGRVGTGRQYMSWISRTDAVRAFLHLLGSELSGAVNLVAPEPVSNAEFARALAGALRRPALLPLPAAGVRLALGEMGREMLLAGQRVSSQRLCDSGFAFSHPTLDSALRAELSRH